MCLDALAMAIPARTLDSAESITISLKVAASSQLLTDICAIALRIANLGAFIYMGQRLICWRVWVVSLDF